MDIRKKTVIIVCITLLFLILALYASSELIVQGGFSQVETRSAQKDTDRALVALGSDINALDAVVHDWASRDDTRQYLAGTISSQEWQVLDAGLFDRLGFNAILITDNQGNLLTGRQYDLARRELTSVSPELGDLLLAYSRPDSGNLTRGGTLGVVPLRGGIMMVSLRPVFSGGDDQTIAGYLLMGRYIDDPEVARLTSLTRLPLEIHPYHDPAMPADFSRAVSRFPASQVPFILRTGDEAFVLDAPTIIEPLDSSTLGSYSLIRDIHGNPALVIRASISRDISAQGRTTSLWFVIMLIITGLVFGMVILVLLEKIVLSRLAVLSCRVNDIGRDRDFSARVSVGGSDEIGDLAGNVNGMLCDLETSQNIVKDRLIQSEEQYRLFFNSIQDPVLVCRVDPDNRFGIMEVNDAACEVLGYGRPELLGMPLSTLLPGTGAVGAGLPVLPGGSAAPLIYEGTCRTKSGEVIPVEINLRSFDQFGSPALVAIIRNISERVEIEHLKKEAFGQIENNLRQFAILNDHIRNPLQGMIGLADMMEDPRAQKIITYGRMIDEIVNRIDRGYIESEKIHKVLRKYYDIGKK
ncbi:MAG: PAS domain S-box protein [Methanomicrobiales archaeon]|nr:PAS domain S-box protein [Methanomicrobiales archaeon]